MYKELLVLAKSVKQGGFCVAGLEVGQNQQSQRVLTGNWIRPVGSSGDQGAAALPFRSCDNFGVFATVGFETQGATPLSGQQENWSCTEGSIFNTGIDCPTQLLHSMAAQSGLIWLDPTTLKDCQVSVFYADQADRHDSLIFIQPKDLCFCLELKHDHGKTKRVITAEFTHHNRHFTGTPVTDPMIRRIFCNQFPSQPDQQIYKRLQLQDQCWLTLSLTLPFGTQGLRYLLVASVIDHTLTLNRSYA